MDLATSFSSLSIDNSIINKVQLSAEEKNRFQYYPDCFQSSLYDSLLQELTPICQQYTIKIFGKEVLTPRISAFIVFNDKAKFDYAYSQANMNPISYTKTPIISSIKNEVENILNIKFNGCLAHIYRDGQDYIGWHNDREAISPPLNHVVSISFGTSRKFRFRRIGDTKGWKHEFNLNSGDMLYMYGECQQIYKHTVPKQLRIKDGRINLTFRVFDIS